MDYRGYLQSIQWQEFREKVLEIKGRRCAFCEATKNLHIHHIDYTNIFKEDLKDVIVVCKDCHHRIHRIKNNGKENRKKYIKVFNRGLNKFNSGMLGKIFLLLEHIEKQTNRLVIYCKGDNKPIMSLREMSKILKITKVSTWHFLKMCKESNFIKKHNRYFYINPFYVMNGSKVNKDIWNLFD